MIFLVTAHSCSSPDTKLFSKLDGDDTGITFINENHETEKSNVLTYEYFYNGGGVALGDINNDGLLDIYFTSNIFENKLYLNKGDLKFEDITTASGTACPVGWKTGVSMVDINSDGFLDIYVCRSASPDPQRRKNILFINNGNNTFTDKAREYGLDDQSYTTQAAFFDFDRDNDLDVFILNHSLLDISNSFNINLKNSNTRFPDVGNRLLKNDGGRFKDVSDSIGVYGPASNYGLGVSLSDINNDGWIDIYAGCDYTGRDRMLYNENGKVFIDATDRLSHISKFTMGTDIADFNGDGLMDIFTVDMLPEGNERQKQLFGSDRYDVYNGMVKNGLHHQYMRNMLHLNLGNGSFSEVGQLAGVANTDWSWAALLADYDNDGMQDLFVTNGFKRDLTDNDFAKFKAFEEIKTSQQSGKNVSYLKVIDKFHENKISNYIFKGSGDLQFTNESVNWGLDEPLLSNGAAYGDLDNDGDLDLVVNNINDPAGVYRNNANELTKNNFLSVRLIGTAGNTNAIGAKVSVYASGKIFVRENLPARGFLSTIDPVLHFGLGKIPAIDSVWINWPDGARQSFNNVSINNRVELTQSGVSKPSAIQTSDVLFNESVVSGAKHVENDFVDFRVQALLPHMYSTDSPAVASGDVNGDGLPDLFVGGAKNQFSQLHIQQSNGNYLSNPKLLQIDSSSEITDAIFVDVDNDRDLDLFLVTGGYEFDKTDKALSDKLLLNDGKGNFKAVKFPEVLSSGSCVTAGDVDQDGDLDLFVGGKIVPGNFPQIPESNLFINDGKGNFTMQNISESLTYSGMVTDARWTDLNKDAFPDLIVVGEWMPVRIFINEKGNLTDRSKEWISGNTEGLWNCILSHDFDGDGDEDFILGNQGLNTQMRASTNQPITLVFDDFDNNGSLDPIVNFYIQGKSYPYPTRDELTEQLPSFRKRFTDYKSYSTAQIENVLTSEELAKAKKLSVTMLNTSYAKNESGKLIFTSMPIEMQVAPVIALGIMDVDGDGIQDVISGGNLSSSRARTGKMTGNTGFVFKSDGKGEFKFMSPVKTGINCAGDVREIAVNGSEVFFGINNQTVRKYTLTAKKDNAMAKSVK